MILVMFFIMGWSSVGAIARTATGYAKASPK